MNILALDVGTSAVKVAILDTDSAQIVGDSDREEYPLEHPTPDAAEMRPDVLWQAIDAAARRVVARASVPIAGVGLSCFTPALILLDAADEPLGPIWTHLDRRSRPVAHRVWDDVGEEFLSSVGNRPLPGGISALCFREQADRDSSLPGRVRRFLHVNGWLGLKLTGSPAIDRGGACFTGLFDTLGDRRWSPRWCDYFGVDPGWLPPVVCGSATLGGLRREIASAWGLPADLPVKLGTADTSSAMLACGLGTCEVLHVVGTTQVLGVLVERPRPDPRRLTRLLGVGDGYVYVVHNPLGGVALDWLRELCFLDQSADEFFGPTIDEALARVAAGGVSDLAVLDPPFLGGDRLEIQARTAAFRNLTLSTTRLDLLATLLAEMRTQHERAIAYLELPGPIRRVVLTGGGADVVRRLIPAYERLPLQTLDEGSLRGVARLFSGD